MLVTRKALCMGEVQDWTISKIKEHLFRVFACNLKQELLETDHHKQGLQNYSYFEAEYGKSITYNNKNISYEEIFTDLKEFCGRYFELKPKTVYDGGTNEVTRERTIFELPTEEEYYSKYGKDNCVPTEGEYEQLQKFVDYSAFFGRGEFPYMRITIIRIGNQDYYFGSLVR